MIDSFDYSGVFIFHSSWAVAVVVFAWLFVPETKNKTLAEIQEKLTKRASRVPLPKSFRTRVHRMIHK